MSKFELIKALNGDYGKIAIVVQTMEFQATIDESLFRADILYFSACGIVAILIFYAKGVENLASFLHIKQKIQFLNSIVRIEFYYVPATKSGV